jgi:hypothetical protein
MDGYGLVFILKLNLFPLLRNISPTVYYMPCALANLFIMTGEIQIVPGAVLAPRTVHLSPPR